MTSAVTADRFVKGDCIASDDKMVGGIANLRANLASRDVPVIVADNVAAYVHSVVWALDEFGKELGNRWFLRPDLNWTLAEDDAAMWLHAAITPALQTIAFMHCRNVVVDRHQRPPKLAKAYRKRHGQEPLRWQTVRLELPRQAAESDEAKRPGTGPSLHIVTGHFSHYGDCCPTQHEPKGKLFGKFEGVYWMPMHLRGDAQHEVRSDRVVTLGAQN